MIWKLNCEVWLVIFGVLVSVLLRAATSLHPYSGQESPPMYGDYEAQRHWMEITTNLPIKEWYRNTSDNNLLYWGLDYPPLTAYHMCICGFIASLINVNYTKLHESRGYESEEHKLFMRYTVLIADILIYIPALLYYFVVARKFYSNKNQKNAKKSKIRDYKPLSPSLSIILALLYPGVILIDHGHFQYNCISLGLFIYAVTFIFLGKHILSSIFFCLALNYKQMELYHALPFFLYLLSTCVPKPGHSAISGIKALTKLALTVIITFTVVWIPFMFSLNDLMQVLHRQFPISRGVFEDKVSNIWCALNIYFKFKLRYDHFEMMRMCLFTTLASVFPSSVDLFLRPSVRKFSLALINSSLAFFLFSFQVHEKSILLVAVPVILYFPQAPFVCFWFLCISVFSMFPLFVKDGLIIALCALSIFYITAFRISIDHEYHKYLNYSDGLLEYYRSLLHTLLEIEYKKSTQIDILKMTYNQILKNKDALMMFILHVCILLSLSGCVILGSSMLIFDPPARYPDIYPLLISLYCCVHFVGFFIYFNVKQMKIPQEFDGVRNGL